ncbi:ethanolamine ammonia-lyase subunit EutC [Roseibacterium beibuensis]|uniref:Ethanolamine ammonia-lyase small subunit n=1 Tax=[Roseibacterium] beibuensis TaxID=1193142 RepID=A0ABP9L3G4_9RHOB|nr:ethanolamine ammonia-lyase subunit EutC [Roseibacterium beibuensis]MCS6623683.1 ethanolamine ammonia-lyase subunit EutC [Roseibacterium beibuensis]
MSDPKPISRAEIGALTQARLSFSGRGRALTTGQALGFALDHAQARAAVLAELDTAQLAVTLERVGLTHRVVASAAPSRDDFIRRPDLGRALPDRHAAALAEEAAPDVALVLGDGLSATAVHLNGPAFMSDLSRRLSDAGMTVSPIILAHQARVALGDKVALALRAKTVVMALGERPGLSAADSLGVYLTHAPMAETPDSARNCISNIREAGTSVEAAADQALRLIVAMQRSGQSGVALNQMLARDGVLPTGP